MKSFLSLSIACLYLGSNVATALVVREDTGSVIPGGIESHFPTHIVKLKARNVQNITSEWDIAVHTKLETDQIFARF